MINSNITFVIFTYNEENRIERVIKNFKGYGNILIADNKSTDRTQEIAKSYGCDVLVREKHYVFVENQEMVNLIYDSITTDWIYWAFADEMVEKKTLLKIKEIVEEDNYDIIQIDRKNYFYGEFCHDLYNAYMSRLFKKKAIDFSDNVIHGMGEPTVPESRIYKMPDEYFVHHFISNTAASYINVVNRYTDKEIESNEKAKTSVTHLIYIIFKHLIKTFFLSKLRVRYAHVALVELTIFYAVIKNMKYYEKEHNLSVPTIEAKNNVFRDQILLEL